MLQEKGAQIVSRANLEKRSKLKPYGALLLALPVFLIWRVLPSTIVATSALRGGNPTFIGSTKTEFQWENIAPSKSLRYTPCFGGFQCARLDVPLNWNATDKDGGPRAAIAVIKLSAKVPVIDERYGGAVTLNPGGPGESGIHQVLSGGRYIQTILDAPGALDEGNTGKYFDIISFDPRGVNNTTPRLKCFPDTFNQQAWLLKYPDYGLLWDSESILGLEWAQAQALGESCSRAAGEDDMVRYANTAQVVEDVVEISERHAEWRQAEAERILAVPRQNEMNAIAKQSVLNQTAWKKGSEMVQYWGFSYGSLLGQTIAAMHPRRVGRLVIDGVLDPEDHYSGRWLKNLQDCDMIITKLCEYCYDAGPEKCPLWTGDSGADVQKRVERIMANLKVNPIAVPAAADRGPEVVTYGDVFLRMLSAMYFNFAWSEGFFQLLAEVDAGNGTEVAKYKQAGLGAAEVSTQCMGTFQAIFCMDSGGGKNLTKADFREYLVELRAQSKWISTSWARNKIACTGYKLGPAWTFEGPIAGKTSHPILIIGNTHDTVTPLPNARNAAKIFPGGVVLQQDSEGHCSYSNPSFCTVKALRQYFQTGALPEFGTICQPHHKPFLGCLEKDEHGDCRKLDAEEKALWKAMTGLTEAWP